MMATESGRKLYDYIDPDGGTHVVKTIRRYVGDQFNTALVDVRDVDTLEEFKEVRVTELVERDSDSEALRFC